MFLSPITTAIMAVVLQLVVTLDDVVEDIPCLLQVPSLMDGLGHLMSTSLGVGVVVGVSWVAQDKCR